MSIDSNRQVRLANRPAGMFKSSDWEIVTGSVKEPAEGEVLVKVHYISLDPAMRGWTQGGRSYVEGVNPGDVMMAVAVGQIVTSRDSGSAEGDYVYGVLNAQEYATVPAAGLTKLDLSLAPLPVHLSALGSPGHTAYFGLLDVGEPKAGDTVVVSGAAGAVGMLVGQIAKIKGCRVVGIAGGPEKCRYLVEELGFDSAIDYKSEELVSALKRECPKGINIYFDNVGGDALNASLVNLALRARIIVCGGISQYNNFEAMKGPSNYMALIGTRSRMEGMFVVDYADRYPEAVNQMAEWISTGKLKHREHIIDGLDSFPEAVIKLFTGESFGKLMLKIV